MSRIKVNNVTREVIVQKTEKVYSITFTQEELEVLRALYGGMIPGDPHCNSELFQELSRHTKNKYTLDKPGYLKVKLWTPRLG